MAQTLFITTEDIKLRSPMGGNVDSDKYLQSVAHAQSMELRPILGVDLMAKIKLLIDTGTLGDAGNEAYQILVDDYVRDFLVNYATANYSLLANYTIANGGVSTYSPDNGSAVSTDEILRLTDKLEDIAKNYGKLMITYLRESSIPEWRGSTTNSNFMGWEIGNSGSCEEW